jgi:type III pantothenate kinase
VLLMDLGNSAVKCQWWSQNQLQSSYSCRFESGWNARLQSYLDSIRPTACYYSSVLDAERERDLKACLEPVVEARKVHRLSSLASSHGLRNGYNNPTSLGVDRWLALLGAAARVRQDAVIIDAGSAITIDLLRATGQHLGGAILPGFNTTIARFKQIMRGADFDHSDIGLTDEPGCSTEACINIDCDSTSSKIVRQLIEGWIERLTSDAVLVVSGGDASLVEGLQQHRLIVMPDLVFRGMRRQLENQ